MDAFLNSVWFTASSKLVSCVYVNHRVIDVSTSSGSSVPANSTFNVPLDFSYVGICVIVTAKRSGSGGTSGYHFTDSNMLYFSRADTIIFPIPLSQVSSSTAAQTDFYWYVSDFNIDIANGSFSYCDKSSNSFSGGGTTRYIFPGIQFLFFK